MPWRSISNSGNLACSYNQNLHNEGMYYHALYKMNELRLLEDTSSQLLDKVVFDVVFPDRPALLNQEVCEWIGIDGSTPSSIAEQSALLCTPQKRGS